MEFETNITEDSSKIAAQKAMNTNLSQNEPVAPVDPGELNICIGCE